MPTSFSVPDADSGYSPTTNLEETIEHRPQNQYEWDDEDLATLRRDRDQMQQVRDLCWLLAPENQHPEGTPPPDEDTITARNYMPEPRQEAHFFQEPSSINDSTLTAVQVIQMHQEGAAGMNPDDSSLASPINFAPSDPETREEAHYNDTQADIWAARHQSVDDDEGLEPSTSNIYWDHARYESRPQALLDALSEHASQLPTEREQLAEGRRVRHFFERHAHSSGTIPRWQHNLARDVLQLMEAADNEYAERVADNKQYWENSDHEWKIVQRLQGELEDLQVQEQPLKDVFFSAVKELEKPEGDPELANKLLNYMVVIGRMTKSNTRKYDVLSWLPGLPGSVTVPLRNCCDYYRAEAKLKYYVKTHTDVGQRFPDQGDEIEGEDDDEEDWAAIHDVAFGYEQNPDEIVNGFGHFVRLDGLVPFADRIQFILDALQARLIRLHATEEVISGPHRQHKVLNPNTLSLLRRWLVGVDEYLRDMLDDDTCTWEDEKPENRKKAKSLQSYVTEQMKYLHRRTEHARKVKAMIEEARKNRKRKRGEEAETSEVRNTLPRLTRPSV